jgi:hypothetical protein
MLHLEMPMYRGFWARHTDLVAIPVHKMSHFRQP